MNKIFLALLVLLALGFGCDSNDNDNGGIQPFNTRECRDCPCQFRFIPRTEECWVATDIRTPENIFSPAFQDDRDCCLYAEPTEAGRCTGRTNLIVREATDTTPAQCEMRATTNPEICAGFLPFFDDLSTEEFNECVKCLEEYATALSDRGFLVRDDLTFRPVPPYKCNF